MVEGFHEENGSLKIDVGAAETNEYGGGQKNMGCHSLYIHNKCGDGGLAAKSAYPRPA